MFRTVDLYLGGVLCTISVVGSLTNLFSLIYFCNIAAQNRNSLFFKRLYGLICAVDFMICFTLFPMIDAAFSPDRLGTLFGCTWFCQSWGILWSYLPIVSIFLVAVLSVSRLLLLMVPTLSLNPAVVWWLIGVYSTGLLTLILSLFFSQTFSMIYRPEWMACSPSVFNQDTNPDDLIQPGDVGRGIVITVLFSFLPGLAIVPISVSGVLSVIYLRRSAAVARNITNSAAQQQHSATVSVITVTLLYVVLNIPFSLTVFAGIILNISLSRDTTAKVTVHDYNTASLTDNPGINNYSYFVIFYLFICLNSFLNPLMYLWRMSGYRIYVNKFLKRKDRDVPGNTALTLQNINLMVSPPRNAASNLSSSSPPSSVLLCNSINISNPLPTIDE